MSDDAEAYARVKRKALDQKIASYVARGWDAASEKEQLRYCAQQVRSFAAEVNGCYLEQRSRGVNYRISEEDVHALWSIADWAEYEYAVLRWRTKDEANDAAWQIQERGLSSPEAESQLASAPKRPKKPRANEPSGCPALPVPHSPRSWDELLAAFLDRRRVPYAT